LENVCKALGIATDGVKADLIQRLRKHIKGKNHAESNDTELSRRNEEEGLNTMGHDHLSDTSEIDLNQQARTLRELAYLSRKGAEPWDSLVREQSLSLENDKLEPRQNLLNKKRRLPNDDSESTESKILTEFKGLKSVVLTMNHKLNTVTAQYDALRKIGKELDLAIYLALKNMGSALPVTQNNWMKGKDSLIEKAKTLVEVKKKSFFEPTREAKTIIQTPASAISVKNMNIMRVMSIRPEQRQLQ
ncbi:9422_t:CDS:2, partial [Acaulospora morrowiae]